MIFGNIDNIPKIQLAIIIIVAAYFFTLGVWLSAIYGGVISLVNTGLINRHTNRQKKALTMSAQASVGMMVISVIMRMILLLVLILIGLIVLKLSAGALIVSLVLGLIGFLMDKVLQK